MKTQIRLLIAIPLVALVLFAWKAPEYTMPASKCISNTRGNVVAVTSDKKTVIIQPSTDESCTSMQNSYVSLQLDGAYSLTIGTCYQFDIQSVSAEPLSSPTNDRTQQGSWAGANHESDNIVVGTVSSDSESGKMVTFKSKEGTQLTATCSDCNEYQDSGTYFFKINPVYSVN